MPNEPNWIHMFVLRFGVCPVTNDYKVVRVVFLKDVSYPAKYKAHPEVEVYSLGTGSWRMVSACAPAIYIPKFMWLQAFVNGAVHWIVYHKGVAGGSRNLIVVFDMADEVFCEMVLPSTLAVGLLSNLSVMVLGKSLAALNYNKEPGNESCCIWVMKDHGVLKSWSKLFTISFPEKLRRTVGFRKNGKVILALSGSEVVSYDPNTRHIKDLGITGNIHSFYVDTYLETLVLLKGQRGVREGLLNPVEACTEEDILADYK